MTNTQFELIQSEKSYLTQTHNTYLIKFADKHFAPNKIEVFKMLKKEGLNPIKITVLNTYRKKKRKGKQSNIISMPGFKKYYVRLKEGETIEASEQPQEESTKKTK